MEKRVKSIILYGVMALYLLLLITMLFFGFRSPIGGFSGIRGDYRSINAVPFRTVSSYLNYAHPSLIINNLLGNIAVFVPLGVYISLLKRGKGSLLAMLDILFASLTVEVLQYVFSRGASDIDDVILNCLGGLLGILGYKGLLLLCKDEGKARTAVVIVSLAVGLPFVVFMLWTM